MNRMRETLAEQERSINWAAKKRDLTRAGLTYKIDRDVFDGEEKAFYADLLNKPVSELFPETTQEEVPA